MELSFKSIMMLIAAFQFILLGFYLVCNSKVTTATKLWFGLFLLGKGVILSLNLVFSNYDFFSDFVMTIVRSIFNPTLFLYTPALYLYIKSQIQSNYKLTKLDLYHFLPSIAFAVDRLVFVLFDIHLSVLFTSLATWLYYIIAIAYSLFALRLVYGFDVTIGNSQQQHNRVILKEWLTKLLTVFSIIMFTFMFSFVFSYHRILGYEITSAITAIGLVLLFIFANGMILQILFKPQIFERITLMTTEKKVMVLPKVVNDITEQKLKRIMLIDKPFLDLEFNAQKLAKMLGIHPRSLSLLLKHRFHTKFNDFVNTYRIAEAKQFISDAGEKINLSQIQYQSGFNSKSVFNDVFKKHVLMTPSEFRDKVRLCDLNRRTNRYQKEKSYTNLKDTDSKEMYS